MKKKSLSLLIAVAMATTMVPSTMAFADTTAPVEDTQEPTYETVTEAPASTYAVTYDTHIQKRGWDKSVKIVTGDQEDMGKFTDAGTSGTVGKALRVEALKLKGTNLPEGASIEYRVHQQTFGWSNVAKDGAEAGVTGKAKRAEAVQITLKGMPGYAIKYQVHVQKKGWMDAVTTENGTEVDEAAVAGTTGQALRIEAIRIQIVKTDAEKTAEVAAINAVAKAEATKTAEDIEAAKEAVAAVQDATVKAEQTAKVDEITATDKPGETDTTVEAISEVTANTVSVVLANTPERELTADDFNVVGNTVTKVEKGNFDTVYKLTLGTSLDNKKGTLSVNGATKDYDFTQLKIQSVKAENLRQLKVTFSKELGALPAPNLDGTYDADDLLNNLHIDMIKEEDGSTATYSFANILSANANDWKAYVLSDKKTVVVESTDGSKLTDARGTGLGLKLNETYEVEALDVVDANGQYSDVSYATDILQDSVRPAVVSTIVDTTSSNLIVKFSEPMKLLKPSQPLTNPGSTKVYIDGAEQTTYTDVISNNTVVAESIISIPLTGLTKGTHTLSIVGAQDLNGNLLSDNGKEISFTITDPADPAEAVTPEVTSISQVADNAFKVVFNTSNVGIQENETDGIVIKNGAYSSAAYQDINLAASNIDMKNITEADGTIHTVWTVVVPATSDDAASTLSYKGANVISKDIVVQKFAVKDDLDSPTTDVKKGKDVTKSLAFKKDQTAPVVSSAANAITGSGDTITVRFNDAPFADKAADVVLGTNQIVTVKYINEKGVTYSEEVTATLVSGTSTDDDNKAIDLQITNPDMLKNGALIAGGEYSIVLPDDVVKDEEETAPTTSSLKYQLLDGQHPFVGKTVTYTVPGAAAVIGKVPQTTRGMIFTGYEVKNSIGTYASEIKSSGKITLKDNQIVVVFDGDVDSATATNKANYTLNGKVLPEGTTIEYRQSDIDNDASNKEKYVVITLADDTVALTGGQDFTVQNVANTQGNKMMPVADVVTLSDNTAPIAKSVKVRDSNKIEVTFSENIDITATSNEQLARNFVINANGKTVSLSNATVESGNKLIITTADNFENNGSLDVPVSVQIKKNSDSDIFIKDIAGNKAKETTVSNK